MPISPSSVHPQPSRHEVSVIRVGPRPMKDRPIARLKEALMDNLGGAMDMWRHSPLEAAFLSAVVVSTIGLGLGAGVKSVDHLGVPEKPGMVQIEGHSFVPAHSNIIGGKFVSYKEDAWYETGKIQGQDPSQTVNVEVSKEEFQSDKIGESIPVVFSEGRFTHALKARRAAQDVQIAPIPKAPHTP